jgi:hypothetical protein
MSFGRTSGMLFLALGGAVGCNAYPTLKPVPIDCTADSAYDVQYIYSFDTTTATIQFFGSGDHLDADVSATPTVQPLTDGPRCGSTNALLLHTEHNDDWGSLFGIYGFGPRDESGYQGLSFWARSPGNTSKAFTVLLDDTNTNSPIPAICSADAGTTPTPVDSGTVVCKNYCMPDGGTGGVSYAVDQNGQIVGGATTNAPPLDACGNQYYVVATVTAGWQFYTFPFTAFRQLAEPNRVPNGHFPNTESTPGTHLLTSALMGLTFRMPPEANMDLWLSHLGFYRQKTGGDGAADAPQDVRGQ